MFSALFRTTTTIGNGASGLPTLWRGDAAGITQCNPSQNMPSTNIKNSNNLIVVNNFVFSFGGRSTTANLGKKNSYKYDLSTDQWTPLAHMSQARHSPESVRLSEDEIFISGK